MQCFKPGDPKVLFKKGQLISEISALGEPSKFTGIPVSLGWTDPWIHAWWNIYDWVQVLNKPQSNRWDAAYGAPDAGSLGGSSRQAPGWAALWASTIHSSTFLLSLTPPPRQDWKTCDAGYWNYCLFSHMLFRKASSLLLSVAQKITHYLARKEYTAGSLMEALIVQHSLCYLKLQGFR